MDVLYQILWRFTPTGKSSVLLTAGGAVVANNQRLRVEVTGSSARRTVRLRIMNVGPEDEGIYTCVVTGQPPVSEDVRITVTRGNFHALFMLLLATNSLKLSHTEDSKR